MFRDLGRHLGAREIQLGSQNRHFGPKNPEKSGKNEVKERDQKLHEILTEI